MVAGVLNRPGAIAAVLEFCRVGLNGKQEIDIIKRECGAIQIGLKGNQLIAGTVVAKGPGQPAIHKVDTTGDAARRELHRRGEFRHIRGVIDHRAGAVAGAGGPGDNALGGIAIAKAISAIQHPDIGKVDHRACCNISHQDKGKIIRPHPVEA